MSYEYLYDHPPQFTEPEAINWRNVALELTEVLEAILRSPADGLALTVDQPLVAAASRALQRAWTLDELWGTK